MNNSMKTAKIVLKKCKIVLGNGYDLYLGMKSRFEDYFNQRVKEDCENLEHLIDSRHEYEKSETFSEDLKYFKENIHLNIWDYILYKNSYMIKKNEKNWYDFEKILYNFIALSFEKFSNCYSEICSDIRKLMVYGDETDLDKYASNYGYYIYSLTMAYLFINGYNGNISSVDFYEHLKNFEDNFAKHIEDEFSSIINKNIYYERLTKFFDNIKKHYSISSIDTFNYTPIEHEQMISKYAKNIYHINGSILTHPIFGYDYKDNDKYEFFSKTLRRLLSQNYCESYESSFPLNEEFDDLIIFGHSLCEMDYSYYFPIFNYMHILEGNYKNSIIIYYVGTERRKDLIFSLKAMLKQYSLELTGRSNERLLDSLSIQGRLKFISIEE